MHFDFYLVADNGGLWYVWPKNGVNNVFQGKFRWSQAEVGIKIFQLKWLDKVSVSP